MVELAIQDGLGISHAIKAQLKAQNVDVSKLDASIWSNILNEVSTYNESLKSSGQEPIFTRGSDMYGSSKENFVVEKDQKINIAEAVWNKIVGFVTGKPATVETTTVNQTQAAAPVTSKPDSEAVATAKAACASDLNAFRAAGVSVSDWDANNTCTLSYQGKTATIKLSDSGVPEYGGDINFMMDYLQESDPAQRESVDNMNAFTDKMEKSGNPVEMNGYVTIKVNGKDTQVIGFTAQDGTKYYLDDNGKEITPDK